MNTLHSLSSHRYLALETVRRSGTPVVTPVWFVQYADQLYFSAPAHTGKVKRLWHTPRGRIAPCDERGNVLGSWHAVAISPRLKLMSSSWIGCWLCAMGGSVASSMFLVGCAVGAMPIM
jgi:PPOX class probable F420-dependent enzyme